MADDDPKLLPPVEYALQIGMDEWTALLLTQACQALEAFQSEEQFQRWLRRAEARFGKLIEIYELARQDLVAAGIWPWCEGHRERPAVAAPPRSGRDAGIMMADAGHMAVECSVVSRATDAAAAGLTEGEWEMREVGDRNMCANLVAAINPAREAALELGIWPWPQAPGRRRATPRHDGSNGGGPP